MLSVHRRARTPKVPGLFSCLLVGLLGCTTVGGSVGSEAVPGDPALQAGSIASRDQREADRLLNEGQLALDRGDFETAERLAGQVESSHATARGSSRALWIRARAAEALGKPDDALTAGRRFRSYLREGDPRLAAIALLEGDALEALGRPVQAVQAWVRTPHGETAHALRRISERVVDLSEAELQSISVDDGPLAAPVLAELALRRRTSPVIGVMLPNSGSPRLREFADLIQEGIRIALEVFGQAEGGRSATELVVQDNGGGVAGVGPALAALESAGALGIVGPLQDGNLFEVARLRQRPGAVISPTAPLVPEGTTGIYSMGGEDPGASRALARYAMASQLATAVVVYPESRDGTFETRAFVETYQALGGSVLGQIGYPAGATFFKEQLREVEALRPDVLVLPLSARDVELMAPQVTFFGLDSLEIRVLGTAGWTEDDVLSRVDPRHTNGVIAASPQPPGRELEGYRRFVDAYEAFHQRTLPSSVPALGYDATALLLEGIRGGARTPAELASALERISDFPGATGLLSVEEGRIVRQHFVVCLQDRQVRAVSEGARSQPILLPPLPDPETASIPEGAPDRIVGFRCPVAVAAPPPGR